MTVIGTVAIIIDTLKKIYITDNLRENTDTKAYLDRMESWGS
jgi:hypothetical protein